MNWTSTTRIAGRFRRKFLLIPAEEADIYLGGHWALVFPHPVEWMQDRKAGQAFESADEKYGKVYRVSNADEMWKLVKAEGGFAYETHPRTKGSTGYPDKILDTDYFKDASYLGTGWKAMPSDLSSPRLGERAFKTLDDVNNLGLHKHLIGEVDVFQISAADELYAHMNINYLRLPAVPKFDDYGSILRAVAKGDGFITTGESCCRRLRSLVWVRAACVLTHGYVDLSAAHGGGGVGRRGGDAQEDDRSKFDAGV